MMEALQADSYTVHFIEDHLQLGDLLPIGNYDSVVVCCDTNTRQNCWPLLLEAKPELAEALQLTIPAGEESKHLATCQQLWNKLFEAGTTRHALWINLGGGVVGDMGGFVASVYKRGIHFLNIPTSLLAMVDATVGGKLGVDHNNIKNGLGLFADPQAVLVCPKFLSTLPEEELRSGFAEMLKHGLIQDRTHLEELMQVGAAGIINRPDLIRRSVEIKLEIVTKDPYEADLRKVLNFGHTLGHAIESALLAKGTPVPHGFAVAWGMIGELELSVQLLGFPQAEAARVSKYLANVYMPTLNIDIAIPNFTALVSNDKKNRGKALNFSLLKDIAKPEFDQQVSLDDVELALEKWIASL